jgi:LacI family transcriptional regulator
MLMQKITIQDVARRAGTSPSTVSRVLTGNANVSQELQQAVQTAIDELGYRPNLLARSLKTQKTLSVGLLINDLTNPFYSVVACSIEQALANYGYNLILCNINENPEQELHYLQALYDKHVDGIIFAPTGKNGRYVRSLARHIPLVQFDRQLAGADLDTVMVDNEGGAFQATELMLEKGHQRIVILGWNLELTTNMMRLAGFKRAMRKAQLEPNPDLIVIQDHYRYQPSEFVALTHRLLSRDPRPTAIFALNNKFGLAALTAIRDLGLSVPDDVALVVFDDLNTFTLTDPAITAVAQPLSEIGQHCVDLLMTRLRAADSMPAKTVTLPVQLMIRESV